MLVCSVSLRPPRGAIAADLAEAAAALDATTTGFVVFATLVDDPASVADHVDAYLGEIMVEAASATDTFSTVQTYSAAIDETLTATDAPDAAVAGAAPTRSAMVDGVFMNTGTSREANANGVMINL